MVTVHGAHVELPRVLSRPAADRLGLTPSAVRHAIRRRGWRRLVPGVVLTAPDGPTRADWAMVGAILGSEQAALSGWDACRLAGIGGHRPPADAVLVLDRSGHHRTAGGVRIRPTDRPYVSHRLSEFHPTLPGGAVVAVARAIADTALVCRSFAPVRALVTSSIQRRLCTPEQLAQELRSCPRNGSALFRRALEDVLDNAHSIAEAEAVDLLRQVRVPAFELNVPILDASGAVIASADVLWRELLAVLEIDSREFHFGENEWKATGKRHNRLTRGSLAVAHYPPSEIRGRRLGWAREVEDWLRGRAAELNVRYVAHPVAIRPGPDGPPPFSLPRL